jgi:hypothetical protein
MMKDTSTVFHIDMLDEEFQEDFDPREPWVFEADAPVGADIETVERCFADEASACAYQRQWRKENGFDEMTGQAVRWLQEVAVKNVEIALDWLLLFENEYLKGRVPLADVHMCQLDLLAACYVKGSDKP